MDSKTLNQIIKKESSSNKTPSSVIVDEFVHETEKSFVDEPTLDDFLQPNDFIKSTDRYVSFADRIFEKLDTWYMTTFVFPKIQKENVKKQKQDIKTSVRSIIGSFQRFNSFQLETYPVHVPTCWDKDADGNFRRGLLTEKDFFKHKKTKYNPVNQNNETTQYNLYPRRW